MAELTDADREILTAYSQLASRIWEDEEYKERAQADPRAALAEHGWEVGPDTQVHLELLAAEQMPEERIALAELAAGLRRQAEAGELRIVVPATPPGGEIVELSDEALAGASGGISYDELCFAPDICGCGGMCR